MKPLRRLGARRVQTVDVDVETALEAMTAPELRMFVLAVLDQLEDEQRTGVVDSLIARAVSISGISNRR